MTTWSPAEVASFDQALKAADSELDLLLETLQILIGSRRESQAIADVAAMLHADMTSEQLTDLVVAALKRIRDADAVAQQPR